MLQTASGCNILSSPRFIDQQNLQTMSVLPAESASSDMPLGSVLTDSFHTTASALSQAAAKPSLSNQNNMGSPSGPCPSTSHDVNKNLQKLRSLWQENTSSMEHVDISASQICNTVNMTSNPNVPGLPAHTQHPHQPLFSTYTSVGHSGPGCADVQRKQQSKGCVVSSPLPSWNPNPHSPFTSSQSLSTPPGSLNCEHMIAPSVGVLGGCSKRLSLQAMTPYVSHGDELVVRRLPIATEELFKNVDYSTVWVHSHRDGNHVLISGRRLPEAQQVVTSAYKLPGPSHQNCYVLGCQSGQGQHILDLRILANNMQALGLAPLEEQLDQSASSVAAAAKAAAAATACLNSATGQNSTMQRASLPACTSSAAAGRFNQSAAAVDDAAAATAAATTAAAATATAAGAVVASCLSSVLHEACAAVRKHFELGLITVALKLGDSECVEDISMIIGVSAGSWDEVRLGGEMVRQHVQALML